MAKIKTRDTAKSGVKAAGKVISTGERMKRATDRAKSLARSGNHTDHDSPEEYAADQMTQGTESITREGVAQAGRRGKRELRSVTERMIYPHTPPPYRTGPAMGQRKSDKALFPPF